MSESIPPAVNLFPESLITRALAKHLGTEGKENPENMEWFFGLLTETNVGTNREQQALSELCEFRWRPGEIQGGAEKALTDGDNGTPTEGFKSAYADFAYWDKQQEQKKKLVIEAKGTIRPIGRRDDEQARRYFQYFQAAREWKGAVVYFVPKVPEKGAFDWVQWLEERLASTDSQVKLGVVKLDSAFLHRISQELVQVVGSELIKTTRLLEQALSLPGIA